MKRHIYRMLGVDVRLPESSGQSSVLLNQNLDYFRLAQVDDSIE
jgi:hypothetical protein